MAHPESAGWFKTPSAFVLEDLRDIRTLGELKVLTALQHFTNSGSGVAWPSITTLADICGLSRRQILRSIQTLVEAGHICRVSIGNSTGETTRYKILLRGDTHVTSDAGDPSDMGDQRRGAHVTGVVTPVTKGRGAHVTPSDDDQTIDQTKNQTNGDRGHFGQDQSADGNRRKPTVTESSVSLREPTDDEIYRAYPRLKQPHVAKAAIARAVTTIRRRGDNKPRAWLLDRVKQYAAARRRIEAIDPGEAQFTPYPQGWFNGGCYDEDPSTWAKQPPLRTNGHAHPRSAAAAAGREDN